ncbi:MAG: erythromycin esterase family protein [Phycisphaerales bacterium JB040]
MQTHLATIAAATLWCTAHASPDLTPLVTPVQPNDPTWIDDHLNNARVVLIGEELHGIAEHIELKGQLARHLIDHHAFTHVLIEDDVFKGDTLNRDLHEAFATDTDATSAGMLAGFYWCWNVQELADAIDLVMRSNHALTLGGFDVQSPAGALQRIREHATPEQRELAERIFTPSRDDYAAFGMEQHESDHNALVAAAESSDDARVSRAFRHLARVQQVRAGGADFGPRMNARDRGMAQSVRDILEQDPSHRVVVWAHNAHAGYEPFYESFTGGVTPLGAHLRDMGYQTLSIGAVFARGETLLDPRQREDDGSDTGTFEPEPDTQAGAWALLGESGQWLLDCDRASDPGTPEDARRFLTDSPPGHFNNYGDARPLATSHDLILINAIVRPATPIR